MDNSLALSEYRLLLLQICHRDSTLFYTSEKQYNSSLSQQLQQGYYFHSLHDYYAVLAIIIITWGFR